MCGVGGEIEYYSTLKRKETLIHVTTLMNLENIPGEISQTYEDKYGMIPLRSSIHSSQINRS